MSAKWPSKSSTHTWPTARKAAPASREARAIARLRHPNIVEIFDCSTEEADTRYIVTEFVDGPNLRDFIETHDVSCPNSASPSALNSARPSNTPTRSASFTATSNPKTSSFKPSKAAEPTNFGIAQILDADTLTATGSLLGSPAHMPPEMIDGLPGDRRGDIFSPRTVLYFLITNGLLPFEGKTPSAVLRTSWRFHSATPKCTTPALAASYRAS